jgi:dienelactone hydrolase
LLIESATLADEGARMIAGVAMGGRATRWGIAVVALVSAIWLGMPYAVSGGQLLDLAGYDGAFRALLPSRPRPVGRRDLLVPTRHGDIAARYYAPDGAATHQLIVFPGIQAGGLDEPRLVAFATRLAATGAAVLSVPLPDLRQFRVTARSTDMIEDATAWMASDPALAPTGRVGLVGISFSGGLALVAAGRPSLADRLSLVMAVGGHGDLPRVMTYLCTGGQSYGAGTRPHDYGVAVIALGAAEHLVPPEQVDAFSTAVLTFLRASSLDTVDDATADSLFETARDLAAALPEPAGRLAGQINARDVDALGPVLLPFVEQLGGAAALSPSRSPRPSAPVFLLHGPDDNVIPATELASLAEDLKRRGNGAVRSLLTPVLRHADIQAGVRIGDAWALARFWTAVRSTR